MEGEINSPLMLNIEAIQSYTYYGTGDDVQVYVKTMDGKIYRYHGDLDKFFEEIDDEPPS